MRIIFGDPISLEVPVEQLPPDSLVLERNSRLSSPGQMRVYIVRDVYKQIWEHVGQTPNIESGGILVGHPFKDERRGITFVVIVAAIPQHSENRGIAHFTVGPGEIAEARSEMERDYPGLVAVGWYHSHPGHGIFLSGQDMNIVRSIYNEDWHVALVIDPKQRAEGIFVGPGGTPIGGRGNHPLQSTWFPIKSEPDSVKAIALYNQIREAIRDQKQQQALEKIERLEDLLEQSDQLLHWGYRDLNVLKSDFRVEKASNLSERDPFSKPNPPVITSEAARDKNKRAIPGRWPLWISITSTAMFAVFFIFTAIWYPDEARNLIVLGLGATISLIAVVTAVYLLASRLTKAETVAAITMMSSTLLVWVGLAFFHSDILRFRESAAEIPTVMPMVEPVLEPTATNAIIETPTLVPSSTPTLLPTATEEASALSPGVPITETLTRTPIISEPVSPTLTVSPTITVTHPGVP